MVVAVLYGADTPGVPVALRSAVGHISSDGGLDVCTFSGTFATEQVRSCSRCLSVLHRIPRRLVRGARPLSPWPLAAPGSWQGP